MPYRERTWFAALAFLSLCMDARADSAWEKVDIPLPPQGQIAVHGGKAVAITTYAIEYGYEDSLKAWVSQGKWPGQYPRLIRGSRSAYIHDNETGEITPFPALPEQASWPPLPNQYPVRLGEDSLRQFAGFAGGDLFYSEKAQPGWKSAVSTPWGGPFESIVLLPDRVLAGTDSGVLVSEDRGANWEYAQGLPRKAMRVVRDGSGECFAFEIGGGTYRSKQGRQWEPLIPAGNMSDSSPTSIWSILISGDTIWAAGSRGARHSGVYRSADAGKTWTLHQTGLGWNWVQSDDPKVPDERFYQAQSMVHDGQALWVLSTHDYDSRPFRSTDGGRSWTLTDAGLTDQYYQKLFTLWGKLYAVHADEAEVSVWSFDPALNRWFKDNGIPQKQPGLGWGINVAVDGDTAWLASGAELYRSVRGTGIWEARPMPWRALPAFPTEYRSIEGMAALGGEVVMLGRLGDGLGNFHASDDGGHSWHIQRPFFSVAPFQGKRLEGRGNRLMVLDSEASRNPRLWRVFPDSIRLLDTVGGRLVVRAGSVVYSAQELDGPWTQTALPDTGMALGIMDGQLVGLLPEVKWVSPDAGTTWTRQAIRFPKSPIRGISVDGKDVWCMTDNAFLAPSANPGGLNITSYLSGSYMMGEGQKMARMENRIFLSGENMALWVYNDPGYSWIYRWTKAELGNASVTALYASNGFFAVASGNGAFRISRGSGKTLEVRSPGPGPITSVTGNPEGLFALVSGGVYFSADSGTNWTPQPVPESLALFEAENRLWVGWTGKDSLIFSKDGGVSWQKEASPLPPGETTALHVSDGAAYLGTRSYGLFRRSLIPPVSILPGQTSQEVYPEGKKPFRRRMQGQGWVFGEDPATARDLRGRTLP